LSVPDLGYSRKPRADEIWIYRTCILCLSLNVSYYRSAVLHSGIDGNIIPTTFQWTNDHITYIIRHFYLLWTMDHIGGVKLSVLASNAIDRGVDSRASQTKYWCCLLEYSEEVWFSSVNKYVPGESIKWVFGYFLANYILMWDDDDVCIVLDQFASKLWFHSASQIL
jgi:hypothetical protein